MLHKLLTVFAVIALFTSAIAQSAEAQSRAIGEHVCVLASPNSLSIDEAVAKLSEFDCRHDALNLEAEQVWLLIDSSDLNMSASDAGLRLRMSYHKDISLTPIANGRPITSVNYPARQLSQYALIPNQLVLPIPASNDVSMTHILVSIDNVWDMTNWRDISIVSMQAEQATHISNAAIFGILLGLLVAPLLLTALVYLALRINFLPYHFGMVIFGIIYGFSWSGMIFVLPFEITPITRSIINHLSIPLGFFFACMLTREFSGRGNLGELWSKALIWAGIIPIITSVILLMIAPDFSHHGSIIYHASFILPLTAICGALIAGSLKGIVICRVQLLAWAPMIGYVILRILRGLGLIEPNAITEYGLFPALLIEALLTTSIICWRIIEMRKERDRALEQQSVLTNLANMDDLTGALNRRAFIEGFNQITSTGRTQNRVISLLTLDLDHFKDVNDAHGHSVGDDVLKGVTQVLKSHCRGEDLCARFGGEEFSILLITPTVAAADGCAHRLREAIENTVFPVAGKVTASIGIVQVDPEAPVPFDSWYSAADKALYVAKAKGRNRVQRSGWNPEYNDQSGAEYASGWIVKDV